VLDYACTPDELHVPIPSIAKECVQEERVLDYACTPDELHVPIPSIAKECVQEERVQEVSPKLLDELVKSMDEITDRLCEQFSALKDVYRRTMQGLTEERVDNRKSVPLSGNNKKCVVVDRCSDSPAVMKAFEQSCTSATRTEDAKELSNIPRKNGWLQRCPDTPGFYVCRKKGADYRYDTVVVVYARKGQRHLSVSVLAEDGVSLTDISINKWLEFLPIEDSHKISELPPYDVQEDS